MPNLSVKFSQIKEYKLPYNENNNLVVEDVNHRPVFAGPPPPPPPPGGVTFEKMTPDSISSFKKDPSLRNLKENLLKKPHQ